MKTYGYFQRYFCLFFLLSASTGFGQVIELKCDLENEDPSTYFSCTPDSGEVTQLSMTPSGKKVLKYETTRDLLININLNNIRDEFREKNTKIAFHYFSEGNDKISMGLRAKIRENENFFLGNYSETQKKKWRAFYEPLSSLEERYIQKNEEDGTTFPAIGNKIKEGDIFDELVIHLVRYGMDDSSYLVYFDDFVIYSGEDKTPPTSPTDVKIRTDNKTRKKYLIWKRATDNIGVASYSIIKENKEVGTSVLPEFEISDTNAKYKVIAVDFEGNKSK